MSHVLITNMYLASVKDRVWKPKYLSRISQYPANEQYSYMQHFQSSIPRDYRPSSPWKIKKKLSIKQKIDERWITYIPLNHRNFINMISFIIHITRLFCMIHAITNLLSCKRDHFSALFRLKFLCDFLPPIIFIWDLKK